MTHSIVILDNTRGTAEIIEHDSFAADLSKYEKDGFSVGVCLKGGEQDLVDDMVIHLAIEDQEDEDDYEPEYTLAGGYAAYDAR